MHRLVRTTSVVVAGLAAALVIAGCSSGSDSKDSGAAPAPSGKSSDSSPGSTGDSGGAGGDDGGGSGGSGTVKAADVEGSWAAMTGGKSTLMVIQGRSAALLGGTVCSGTVTGTATLSLKCPDGNTDRTTGSIESADGKTLTVSWNSGIKDTFKKTDGKKIPGVPSAS
ncbi:hypothetical protein AB0M87_29560 [Streptomyces sp. NPDC051320]|uniref:hypothetical protein n=1 Tax=Streptomyces sp. NPDC051320 TaxID=3154644 RepID=UPI0034395271